jgi:hypothetical protein
MLLVFAEQFLKPHQKEADMEKKSNIELGRYLTQKDMANRKGKPTPPLPAHLKGAYEQHLKNVGEILKQKGPPPITKKKIVPKSFIATNGPRKGKVVGPSQEDPLNSLGSKMASANAQTSQSSSGRCHGVNKDGSPCGNTVVKKNRCQWH